MQIFIQTPLKNTIQLDLDYLYKTVLYKHPALLGKQKEIIRSLESPFSIRRSRHDPDVLLHYSIFENRMICSVIKVKRTYSFLITSYPCTNAKPGEVLWQK